VIWLVATGLLVRRAWRRHSCDFLEHCDPRSPELVGATAVYQGGRLPMIYHASNSTC